MLNLPSRNPAKVPLNLCVPPIYNASYVPGLYNSSLNACYFQSLETRGFVVFAHTILSSPLHFVILLLFFMASDMLNALLIYRSLKCFASICILFQRLAWTKKVEIRKWAPKLSNAPSPSPFTSSKEVSIQCTPPPVFADVIYCG